MSGACPISTHGISREELLPALRSLLIGNYLIFYLSIEGGIELIRILAAMRDIEALF